MYNCFGQDVLNLDLKLNSVVVKTSKELKSFLKFFSKFKEKNQKKRFILKLAFSPTEKELEGLKEENIEFYVSS